MRLAPGTRLGPYEIVSPLGAGGMGEVYRARDGKLRREVAIKVLPETLADDEEARARFEREALSVAALSHPNILAIHDFGVENGMTYAVTELLEGETLRSRLARGPVPPSVAIGYALQIAAGLSAAHEKGIVHRDLKPENLFLLRDDHVKILDFGLARRTPPPGAFDETPTNAATAVFTDGLATSPGRVMGTLAYMSPEQLRGKAVDARSDIFSFGAILYEMISGRPAFRRDAPADTMAAILTAEPPALSESQPLALDRLVRHCLEKEPRNRFQSARDVAYALGEASSPSNSTPRPSPSLPPSPPVRRRPLAALAGALVGAVLLALVVTVFSQRSAARRSAATTQAAEQHAATRVAVLPFENLGPPAEDYFVDGISDAVRAKMTSVPGIQVIARASSVSYRKTKKSQREISGELDAPYLLTATVRWEKSAGRDRVRVIPELVEVGKGGAPSSKWQQPFDASLTDVFEVQGEIAARVVQELGVALGSPDRKRLAGGFTKNVAAYDAFLRGEEEWYAKYSEGAAPDIRKGLGDYETAVALDPQFAEAWARIGEVNSVLYGASTPGPEIPRRAREAAEKAVALAPDRPAGYLARGDFFSTVAHDNARALADLATARRLDPGSAEILNTIGDTLLAKGDWEESIRLHRDAEKLDPRTASHLGFLLMCVHRYSEAASSIDRQLAALPGNVALLNNRTMVYLAQGDLGGARRFLASNARSIEQTQLIVDLGQAYDLVWVLDDAQRALLLRLTPSAFDDNKPAWALALAQASALSRDEPGVKRYAEEANRALEEQIQLQPDNGDWHSYRGLALAYLGRGEEAIREGKRGCELLPISRDAVGGAYYQHLLVRIYIMAGQPDRAIDALEPLLRIPYVLSPGWLRIDPNFDPLRGNPRFEKLLSAPA